MPWTKSSREFLRDKNVLIVDDEPRNLDLLEVLLEPTGCRIRRARGGAEALEEYERERPDLVLLDLMMPSVNGFDVLSLLREHRSHCHVPVIVVTAAGEREARLRAFELGADEFLDKPVDRQLLIQRAQNLLELATTQEALSRRNHELLSLQAQQQELTALLVHDFKNPVSVIRHNVEWLARELADEDDEVSSAISDVATCARRLAGMAGDLLAISRLDVNDAPPIQRQLCAPSKLARELIHETSHEAAARGIRVALRIEDDREWLADPQLLRRALANLVENALRYTPPDGRIEVLIDSDELSVSNTGAEIPEAERTRIFEKFRRADGSNRHGSVGLGLYFCRRVAEAHGGTIEVSSESEWPVRFRICIAAEVSRRKAC